MSTRILLNTIVTLAISGCPVTSVIAMSTALSQTVAQPVNPSTQVNPGMTAPGSSPPNQDITAPEPLSQPSQKITIPTASAVPVTFCSTVKFNAKQKSGFPVTVYLTRPIIDSNGNQLVPANSLVSAQLKPTKEGVQIKAENLVIGGQVVPVQTSVLSVPILSETRQEDYYAYEQNPGLPYQVADNLQDWLGDQGILSGGTSDLLGFGLAVASGVSTGLNRPKRTETMEVPEGSTFVFQLLSPVDLPPTVTDILSRSNRAPISLCSEETELIQDSSSEDTSDSESEPDNSYESDSEPEPNNLDESDY